jgi:beta-mannosidase
MTIGPWKPVSLHTYNIRFIDLDVRSKVSEALDVKVTVDLTLSEKTSGSISVVLRSAQGYVIHTENGLQCNSGSARAEFHFSPGELELWYPVGYGKQPLYTIEVTVSDSVRGLHCIMHKVAKLLF